MGPEYSHRGTICVLPLNAHVDTSAFKKYRPRTGGWYGSTPAPDDGFAKIGLSSSASCSTEDWDGEDVWSHSGVQANTLVAEVGHLGINGLNQDLFMLYLLALVQPSLSGSGEDPFEEEVNSAKCSGLIPLTPEHHLWYDLWKLHLQK